MEDDDSTLFDISTTSSTITSSFKREPGLDHLGILPVGIADITTTSSSNELADCGVTSSSTQRDVEYFDLKPKRRKLLPPCRICGEKASGLHYGVNTCEACKGFFRRSNTRGANFQCAEEGECMMKPGKRNNCAACRYKKCLAAGMSKDAIKIGRYTHEKRTQDIREVKNMPSSSAMAIRKVASHVDKTETQLVHHLLDTDVNHLPSIHEQKVVFSMSVVDEMQKYVQKLSEALVHMKYFFAAKTPALLNHLVQNRLDVSKLETDLLGEEVMPNKEYIKVMAETGLDLDQRKELIQHWAEGIEETFIVVAQFAKCTPGFKSLPLDDQITLIKATRSQLLFTASHKRFDVKHRCFIGRFNRVESYQDIVKVYNNKQFVDMMIDLASKFMQIRLTDIEWLLVLALIMTYPDDAIYSQLSEGARTQLHAMHFQQLRILDFYLRLNHPDKPELAAKIHQTCQDMREGNDQHNVLVGELREVWVDFYNFPPLFTEIMQIDFGPRRVIPRLKPKSPQTESAEATARPIAQRHWKKSTIAHILESSEYFDKLMSAATTRSRDDNIRPPTDLSVAPSVDLNDLPASEYALPMTSLTQCQQLPSAAMHSLPSTSHSSAKPPYSLSSKLNTCYGVSFGDPLSPLTDDIVPLSKCLDQPFTSVCELMQTNVTTQNHLDLAMAATTQRSTTPPLKNSGNLYGPIKESSAPSRPIRAALSAYKRPPYKIPNSISGPYRPVGRGKDDSIFVSADEK